jgi:hypothetical protein
MDDSQKRNNADVSELIRLHLELKAKAGEAVPDDPGPSDDVPEAIGTLPPRKTLFPSNRRKLVNLFYNTLLVLFVLLLAGLTVWGFRLFGGG